MLNTQYFTAKDGFKIAYYEDDFTDPWKTPDTVLLLHAAMGNAKRWFSWMPAITRQYKVVRMELRGHGNSQKPRPDQDFSLGLLVSDALELMDKLGLKNAHVVGNSAGGYVAQQMAIHHGARVKTLALYGATPGLKNSHAHTWIPIVKERGLKKFLADTIYERFDSTADQGLVQWFIEQAGSNDPEFIARFVLHMTTHEFMDDLVKVKCPTMIVAAGKEQIGHASAYAEMQKRIAGSELKLYDTAGHNICDGYAAKAVGDLMDFLARRGNG